MFDRHGRNIANGLRGNAIVIVKAGAIRIHEQAGQAGERGNAAVNHTGRRFTQGQIPVGIALVIIGIHDRTRQNTKEVGELGKQGTLMIRIDLVGDDTKRNCIGLFGDGIAVAIKQAAAGGNLVIHLQVAAVL